jgi:hypothetical protein
MSVGSLIAWPSLVTHPHLSAPITSGVKYSLNTLFFAHSGESSQSVGA